MDVHNIDAVEAFTTKDGSEIRELLAHRNSCIRLQSLADVGLGYLRLGQPTSATECSSCYAAVRRRTSTMTRCWLRGDAPEGSFRSKPLRHHLIFDTMTQ